MSERTGHQVLAAGGIVWRRGGRGALEVLVIHRPRYRDWSFPKGKCDPGEGFREAAAREVHEEVGLEVAFDAELGDVEYLDHKGRAKLVRYWAMRPLAGRFAPNDEVDVARWVDLDEAREVLTYDHDRALLERLPAVLPPA
ncbi:MAG: NUDIX hydrolase [Acidimicrobiales bacterium]